MKDQNSRSSRPRKRAKRKVFSPHSRVDPLAGLFKEKKPDFSDRLAERPKDTAQEKAKPAPPAVRKNFKIIHNLDPVVLFAAYHLGVTEQDTYRPQNIHDLARRFNLHASRVTEALVAYDLDAETVMSTDFDMGMAQIDIKVAPEGISKMELARQLYDEFRSSPKIVRQWREELQRDAEENRKIFDKLK